MTAKSKESVIATKKETAIDVHHTPRGFENFDIKDMIFPRLRLLQGLSKAVTDGVGSIGQFQDSLTEEILGNTVEIVLLGLRNGAVYFKRGEGMKCKSEDGIKSIRGDTCEQCPFDEYWATWKPDGDPPGCSGTKEFISLLRPSLKEQPYPIIVSFMKTSYGLGKRLASMARFTGKDIFARSYIIGSEMVKNEKGSFSKFTIKPNGDLDKEEFKTAEKWFEMVKGVNIKTQDDDSEIVSEI